MLKVVLVEELLGLEPSRNCRRVLLINENGGGLNVCSVKFCRSLEGTGGCH
jgi:hypothetical protein